MSETPPKLDVDALLHAWPEVEKSAMELDESARTIMERAQTVEPAGSASYVDDEKLLAAPLGQSAEDGHNSAALLAAEVPKMTMPADRERDRRSLQDLAKMAQTGLTPPPPSAQVAMPSGPLSQRAGLPAEAKADDSGMIDLRVAAQSDPAAPARAQATPLASQGLFDEEPASVRPPPSAQALAQQPVPSMPPMPASMAPQSVPSSAPVPSAHASASQPAMQAKKGKGAVVALLVGGIVAVSAAAAGTFFYLKTHAPAPEAPVAATEAPPPDVAPAPTVAAAAQPSEPTEEAALDPASLPTAAPDEPKDGAKVALAPKASSKGGRTAPSTPAEAPKAEAKLTQKDLPQAPTGPAGDLGTAMGKAVGDDGKPKSTEPVPAAGTNVPAGSVPQKPSQGAVTGAIGAVLGQARACLGPDDPVSHASIVFGSTGAVQSVSVTGAAAGKPAEACIKGALMKAKVGPFAEPSYATRVTVRHP